jgi:adhesin/invasin
VTATATAAIVGQSAEVLFAGLAPGYVGVGQVDVVVPSGLPAGEHMLVIAIGGVSSNEAEIGTQ